MKVEKIQCAECDRVTNHEILAEQKASGEVAGGDIKWWETYQIVRCRGCEAMSFRKSVTTTEDWDPYTGELIESETLFPDRSRERTPIQGYELFPKRTRTIYLEVLRALHGSTPILAAVGLRALIESICLDQSTKGKNLKSRIDELAASGLLSTKQAEYLHAHRFMGNSAAHEIIAPRPQELLGALDIAETLLKTIYILPDVAASLRATKAVQSSPSTS